MLAVETRSIGSLRTVFPVILLLYTGVGLLLLPQYKFQINPDGVSYVSLAKLWLAGDLSHAVSAYWSPMMSWLLTPLLYAGLEQLLAAKLVTLLSGILLLVAARHLLRFILMPEQIKVLLLLTLAVMTLSWAFSVISPDLLLAALFTAYLSVLFDPAFLKKPMSWVILGVIGGLSYLTKSVALPLFLAHIGLSMIILALWKPSHRSVILRSSLTAVFFFLLVSVPWICIISSSEQEFTIGMAGRVIHASEGPGNPSLPILTQGLFPPAFPGAVSAWENPSMLPLIEWHAFDSTATLIHQVKMIVRNAAKLTAVFTEFSWLWFAIFIAALLLCIPDRSRQFSSRIAPFSLASIALICAAYLPILIDTRYFWTCAVLLLLLGGYVLSLLIKGDFFTPLRTTAALLLFSVSFVAMPLTNLLLTYNDGKVFAEQLWTLGETYQLAGKKLAADKWKQGLYLSYFTGAEFYGQPKKGDDLEAQLFAQDIDVYVTWGEMPDMKRYRLVTGTGAGLKISERM